MDVRPAWWHEVLLIAATYGAYTLTRNTLPEHVAAARANAHDLYDVERWLGIDVEHGLNDALAAHPMHPLAVVADYAYSLPHLMVTAGVLLWLYLARPRAYRPARAVLLVTTVLALLGFWLFPLAPPRFFPAMGFVDTVVRDDTWGSWGSAAVTSVSNQYAAMPSVHIAWSTWVAVVVARNARHRWVRRLVPLYPVFIAVVVVATANHWVLDIAGGLAVLALGVGVCATASRGRAAIRRRSHPGRVERPGPGGPAVTSDADGVMSAWSRRREP